MSYELLQLAEEVTLYQLKVTIKLNQKLHIAPFKGQTWRGALGHALAQLHPDLYAILNAKQNQQQSPNSPYFFTPPLSEATTLQRGDNLTFEICLFDQATQFISPVLQSLFLLEQMGLGEKRVPFTIDKIQTRIEQHWITVFQQGAVDLAMPSPILLSDLLQHPLTRLTQPLHAFVKTTTPLLIKKDGHNPNSAPSLSHFLFFTANRLANLLAHTRDQAPPIHHWLPEQINDIAAQAQSVKRHNQRRLSVSTEQVELVNGITGSWEYSILPEHIPWLQLAQTLHIGKKVSLGLGASIIEFAVPMTQKQ
ncbi:MULTISPECIES: CRISPR system precrRNA processing endoribonuclease RAMP protein Cas6 [Pseudoalteromonas]|uniref:CRISPR system precrRNA processing endoribonuclease RAMP protein Cas6 n=1 Tax=Pseudoalteromonas TaxID=53246 RepID=UPI0019D256AC|nr:MULTISPECIES: CRISPR system precrRNA processing endoribonuclease RAMP protein Cas6 [Pseudoalteromonas]MBR8842757.1 CRISPR system precrRNA processing endoribonuclease RAMP protein Cas6 [Pseudoalteromonas sp. JC3]UDM62095.1 CRISPR system precrRNA processing endoribonuclease RAMP protein Cas6 [Pseudoalteromonas piscicida]WJE10229.1 CRISPR system precrRNA processing endoribonuclease RAMP protein Cas6 [Pseudoalteromonas sp. JC3]